MSYSFREGKDEVHFITEEDLKEYTAAVKEEEDSARRAQSAVNEDVQEQYPGAVSENGEINWDCPCLGGFLRSLGGTCIFMTINLTIWLQLV